MANGVRLVWEGKRPAATEFEPLPVVERIEEYGDPSGHKGACNRLIHGDNLAVMAALREELARRMALIYLDPPFFTGTNWQAQGVGKRKEGNAGTRLPAFTDDWDGDLGAYMQWLYDRLALARELLAEDGSLYVHLSWHAAHYVKLLLDEIFGPEHFQNEIIWCYREAINSKKRWNRKHDTLLFYSKGKHFTFNYEAVREPYAESHVKKYRLRDGKGPYRLMGRGIANSPLRSRRDLPPQYETQFPGLTYRHYLGEGTLPVDYWQIDIENQASHTRTGYPTQKPEALLERILLASSNPGDLIADFCCGSGTTLAVAARLERQWIGCDAGALAIHTARKRLLERLEGAHFVVERAQMPVEEQARPAQQAMAARRSAVCLEQSEGGARVRLAAEAASWVDMWAVEWRDSPMESDTEQARPFRPQWWSARTRRCPSLAEVSPVYPVGGARMVVRVALADAAGETFWVDLSAGSAP
ncbi:MAG TPA: DNA methyltransferase [Chthonomonadaceae bacterium]|nr:DNA methyltransferase [Chthonomonadaceae bacterium]